MIVSASAAGSTAAFDGDFSRRSSALLTIALKALMTWCPTPPERWPRSVSFSWTWAMSRSSADSAGRGGFDIFDGCPAKEGP